MITVGIISTNSTQEQFYSVFICLLLAGTFAYSLSAIGSIAQEMAQKDNELKMKIRDINHYLTMRGVNDALKSRARKYISYMHSEAIYGHERGRNIFTTLPPGIIEQVKQDAYFKLFNNIKVFGTFSKEFEQELCQKLGEQTFAPEDFIFDVNLLYLILYQECNENQLIYVKSGIVETGLKFQKVNGQIDFNFIKEYNENEVIGIEEFLKQAKRPYQIRAKTVVHIIFLNEIDFLNIIRHYPTDREKFAKMRDELVLYQNRSFLHEQCPSCGQLSHSILQCKLLGFQEPQTIIAKYLKQKFQQREMLIRREYKTNALMEQWTCEDAAYKIQTGFEDTHKQLSFKLVLGIQLQRICKKSNKYKYTPNNKFYNEVWVSKIRKIEI